MIQLQSDNTGRRTNTADYETEGGNPTGLSNEDLKTFVEMLKLEEEPKFYREIDDGDITIATAIYYSLVIDSYLYGSITEGGFWGRSIFCGLCTEVEAENWIDEIDEIEESK